MKNKKVAAKVQPKLSLQELLQSKVQQGNFMKVSIPFSHILGFNPENPVTETISIMGSPRKVVKWEVRIDGVKGIATFQVGQVARLYQAILEETLPEGVTLEDSTQSVDILTEKTTTNSRGVKTPNGALGFINLSPFTVKAAGMVEEITGFIAA